MIHTIMFDNVGILLLGVLLAYRSELLPLVGALSFKQMSLKQRALLLPPALSAHSKNTAPEDTDMDIFRKYLVDVQECEGIEATRVGFRSNEDSSCEKSGQCHGKTQEGTRGVFATEHIRSGEYICDVPFVSTILLDESVVSQENDEHFSAPNLENDLNDTVRQALKLHFLLHDSKSPWTPYFRILPKLRGYQFDETPDFWSREEIEQLGIPFLIEKLLRTKEAMLTIANENNVDVEDLQYAHWLVQSRAFTTFKPVMTLDGKALLSRTVLVPYFDLINHEFDPNAELQVVETKEYDESFYALAAIKDIKEGDEISIRYGTGTESFLDIFCSYGFLPPANSLNDNQFLKASETTGFKTSLEEDKTLLEKSTAKSRTILDIRVRYREFLERNDRRECL